jgi:hypothetical protein
MDAEDSSKRVLKSAFIGVHRRLVFPLVAKATGSAKATGIFGCDSSRFCEGVKFLRASYGQLACSCLVDADCWL